MIITVANHKGGVAKTSTVLAIAEIITSMQENDPDFLPEEYRQKPVLVLDIDPQANATEECYKRFYAIRSVLHGSLGIAPGGLGFPET